MKTISTFSDLESWKQAHELVALIYLLTNSFPQTEIYGLTSQLRRASVSVTANIAEGFSRFHYKDRLRFYYDARGSLSEVQSELMDAQNIGILSKENFDQAFALTEKVHLILGGLIRKTTSLTVT